MAIINLNETYYCIMETESSNVSTFTSRDSSSIITFVIRQDQILNFINDVLGSAKLTNNSFITRVIPASHPFFPWQYAYKISDIKGYKPNGKEQAELVKAQTTYKNMDVDTPAYVGSYEYYKIAVLFQSRDYNIYRTEQLQPYYSTRFYYMPIRRNFQGDIGERLESYTNRKEHWRYTTFTRNSEISLLTYGGGSFWVKRGAGGPPGQQLDEFPISMENGGQNNLKIVKWNLDINWFFVPFELSIKNKLWTEAYSKVNLYPFFGMEKGTTLFKEVAVKKYEPYYPFETIDLTANSSVYDYYTEYNKNQYCDISFKFSYFTLPKGVVVIPDPATYEFLQCKDVASPHNLLLSPTDLNWYYFESQPQLQDPARPNKTAAPLYWNYDMERLFYYVEGA